MQRRFAVLPIALAMALAGAAGAASLNDAPVASHPTLGTELKRGSDAGVQCSAENPVTDADAFDTCIEKAQAANAQKATAAHDAFDAGIYFRAWVTTDMMASVANDHSGEMDASAAQQNDELDWRQYVKARHVVDLTDEQVVSVMEMKPAVLDMMKAAASKWGD